MLDMKQNHFSIRRIILILLACFMSGSIMAEKVNRDTLDIGQLNLYRHKAVTMRNAGMILTFCGVGIVVTSIIYENIPKTPNPDHPDDPSHDGISIFALAIADMAGFIHITVCVFFWAFCGGREIQ